MFLGKSSVFWRLCCILQLTINDVRYICIKCYFHYFWLNPLRGQCDEELKVMVEETVKGKKFSLENAVIMGWLWKARDKDGQEQQRQRLSLINLDVHLINSCSLRRAWGCHEVKKTFENITRKPLVLRIIHKKKVTFCRWHTCLRACI